MTMQTEVIKRTRTADGIGVLVLSSGDVTDLTGRTWTMHRALAVSTALLVAGEACLFDAAEMPSLIAAAHKVVRKSPNGVLPGNLRSLASRLSHKAGTRPPDVPPPSEKPRKAAKPGPFLARNSETGIPVWIGGVDSNGRLVAEDPR